MWLIATALAIVFVQPTYYKLRAKGYRPKVAITVVIVVSAVSLLVGMWYPEAILVACAVSGGMFVLAVMLPKCEGAPGEAYLRLNFDCRACGQTVVFPRERQFVCIRGKSRSVSQCLRGKAVSASFPHSRQFVSIRGKSRFRTVALLPRLSPPISYNHVSC